MKSGKDEIKNLISQDNRRSERLHIPANLFYSYPSSTEWIGPQSVEDVGGDGLKFKSNTAIEENTELRLKINLAREHTPIIFMCKVARCTENLKTEKSQKTAGMGNYSIGVKFYKMCHEDRQRYVNFICGKIITSYFNEEDNDTAP